MVYFVMQRLRRLGLSLPLLLFIVALLGLPWIAYEVAFNHAEREARRNAQQFSRIIATVRSYYAANVAGRVLANHGQPVVLTENYRDTPGGIPIPATLSIELGDLLHQNAPDDGFRTAFLSDQPFGTRQRPPLDDFQRSALQELRAHPTQQEVWRVEPNADGGTRVRLAIPVRMEPTCVYCHNGHPDSPVHDWREGDVRGIQDISVAVSLANQTGDSWLMATYLLFFIGTATAALREHHKANAQLLRVNEDVLLSRSYLEDSEHQLKLKVDELSTLSTVLQKAPFGITIADPRQPDLPLIYVNEAFLAQTGYTEPEVLGRNCRFLQGPDTRPETVERIREAIRQGEAAEIEILNYRKSGAPYWVRLLVFPSYDSEGQLLHYIGCQTDITELKKAAEERGLMESELQESLKLESLGLTIAGIAHDLNTPIGVAVTAASLVEQQVQKLDRLIAQGPLATEAVGQVAQSLAKSSQLIGNNLQKAATLVRSFKQTTADASRNEWRVLQLHPFMESLLLAVSPLIKRAQCVVDLQCPEGLSLYTEPGSLMQVITNLVVNATLHAFEDRGHRSIRLTVTADDFWVHIEVSDNGNGMSEDALAKAFTPFFTTRRSSGGSGLGLFSSRRAVEAVLGGRIAVTSTAGQGTTFLIQLPRTLAAPTRRTA